MTTTEEVTTTASAEVVADGSVAVAEAMTPEATIKAKQEAYSAAQTALRVKYLAEFHALVKAEMAERGIEWSPKPTKAEREAAVKAEKKAKLDAKIEKLRAEAAELAQ